MAESPPVSESTPESEHSLPGSLRRRAVVVVVTIALMAGSTVALGRVGGRRVSAVGSIPRVTSGAWFCPHGGAPGWQGWVVIANPGSQAVRVRMTTFGADGGNPLRSFSVAAGTEVYRQVPAAELGASTEVEYFGGWVGVSAVLSTGSSGGIGSERCLGSPQRKWYIPDEAATAGESAYLVVMNPFAEAAAFDVSLFTASQVIRPGNLMPYVVPARSSAAVRLGDYALLGPGERSLAVQIVTRLGRILAGGYVTSGRGLRDEAALGQPATQWVVPSGGFAAASRLVVLNAGAQRADLSVLSQGASGQQLVSGPNGLSVPAGIAQTFPVGGLANAGTVIQSTNKQPVALVLELTGPGGDAATLDGATEPAARWIVLPSLPPVPGRTFLVVQNAGRVRAQIRLTAIGPEGQVQKGVPASLSIAPGRTRQIALPEPTGAPISVMLEATSGAVVAGSASLSLNGFGYAATLGTPIAD
jgi:hypothetical protein